MEAHLQILYGILVVTWLQCLWGVFLHFQRWYIVNNTSTVPKALRTLVSVGIFQKIRLYTSEMIAYRIIYTSFTDGIKPTVPFHLYFTRNKSEKTIPCLVTITHHHLPVQALEEFRIAAHTLPFLANTLYLLSSLNLIVVSLLVYAWSLIWMCSQSISSVIGYPDCTLLIGLIFLMLRQFMISLSKLPFQFARVFLIQRRYGLVRNKRSCFVLKLILELDFMYLSFEFFFLSVNTVNELSDSTGPIISFFISCTIFFFVVYVRDWIEPRLALIDDNCQPLEDGNLRRSIKDFVSSVNFEPAEIYEASITSIDTEEFPSCIGVCIGPNTIALNHQVVENMTEEEIVALLAQKIGCTRDIIGWIVQFVVQLIFSLLVVLIIPIFLHENMVLKAFNFYVEKEEDGRKYEFVYFLILSNYICIPVQFMNNFLLSWCGRYAERKGDEYAARLRGRHHLRTAIIKLCKINLCFPDDGVLYSIFMSRRPSILTRLEKIST